MNDDRRVGTAITTVELIPSKDVRAYMEEKGRVLTDFEKATLIYNHSGMNFTEKAACLKELMELTEDSNLREEIQDRLSYEDRCISRFYENDGSYIYGLEVYDAEAEKFVGQGYSASGSMVVKCGKKFQEKFNVYKIMLMTEDIGPDACQMDHVASIHFDHSGRICACCNSEVEWIAGKFEWDRERFENAYIEIQHPFENGSIVRVKNNDRLEDEHCIVECYNDELEEQNQENYDYSDTSLRIAYIYGVGRFGHEHVNIVDLEFATPDETDLKYELLHCARNLILGKGGLNEFQMLCDIYCEKAGGDSV